MVFRVRSPIKVVAGKMRNFQSHPIVYLRNSIGIMTLFCLVLLYVIWSSTGKLDINHFSIIYCCYCCCYYYNHRLLYCVVRLNSVPMQQQSTEQWHLKLSYQLL